MAMLHGAGTRMEGVKIERNSEDNIINYILRDIHN